MHIIHNKTRQPAGFSDIKSTKPQGSSANNGVSGELGATLLTNLAATLNTSPSNCSVLPSSIEKILSQNSPILAKFSEAQQILANQNLSTLVMPEVDLSRAQDFIGNLQKSVSEIAQHARSNSLAVLFVGSTAADNLDDQFGTFTNGIAAMLAAVMEVLRDLSQTTAKTLLDPSGKKWTVTTLDPSTYADDSGLTADGKQIKILKDPVTGVDVVCIDPQDRNVKVWMKTGDNKNKIAQEPISAQAKGLIQLSLVMVTVLIKFELNQVSQLNNQADKYHNL